MDPMHGIGGIPGNNNNQTSNIKQYFTAAVFYSTTILSSTLTSLCSRTGDMASRKERVRQINIENNKDRMVEQWAEEAARNADDDYVTQLLKHQEEGGLQNKAQHKSSDEAPCRKDRVRLINIETMQSELYSKDKKSDSGERVQPGYNPSFHKFVKVYIGLFLFVVIFGFAVYVTEL
jgi:hypothetical protein